MLENALLDTCKSNYESYFQYLSNLSPGKSQTALWKRWTAWSTFEIQESIFEQNQKQNKVECRGQTDSLFWLFIQETFEHKKNLALLRLFFEKKTFNISASGRILCPKSSHFLRQHPKRILNWFTDLVRGSNFSRIDKIAISTLWR